MTRANEAHNPDAAPIATFRARLPVFFADNSLIIGHYGGDAGIGTISYTIEP